MADILPSRTTLFQRPRCSICGASHSYLTLSALVTSLTGHCRCGFCGYPRKSLTRSVVVELISMIIFIFLFWSYGFSLHLGLLSIYTAILILTTVTNLECGLIFNIVMLPAILLATFSSFFTPGLPWPSALVGGAGAFIATYLLALLARGGLGEGVVFLSTFLGLILGFPLITLNLGAGILLGGIIALWLLFIRRVEPNSFIPYGPFFTIPGWFMLIWNYKTRQSPSWGRDDPIIYLIEALSAWSKWLIGAW